jgi:hypothetical protein
MRGTLRGVSQYPPQPPPYGQPPPTNHPQATTVLVLGILSLVVCGVLGPFAWSMGSRALREIDASQLTPTPLGGRETVNIGRILGIVGTALLVLGLLAGLAVVVIGITSSTSP